MYLIHLPAAIVLSILVLTAPAFSESDPVVDDLGKVWMLIEVEEYAKAEQQLRAIIKKDRTNLIALNNLSVILIRAKQFEEADRLFSIALDVKTKVQIDRIGKTIAFRNRKGNLKLFTLVQPPTSDFGTADIGKILRRNKEELNN